MSTTVCQALQTSFGPWLDIVQPSVTGFDLSLPSRCPFRPPDTNQHQGIHNRANTEHLTTHNDKSETECNSQFSPKNCSKREKFGGLSFLLALSDTSQSGKRESEEVYVHPLVKRSASMLSENSLKMCTESLGSESGSDMSENGDELIASLGSDTERSSRMRCFGVRKRSTMAVNFPPPLTTISGGSLGGGGGRVQMKSHREYGRLVMEVVNVETHQSCFKAERSDGRLRLHFLPSVSCSSVSRNGERSFDDDECNTDDDDDDDDEEEEFDHDFDGGYVEEEEAGNFSVSRGCKEEGDDRTIEIFNWESCWVATS